MFANILLTMFISVFESAVFYRFLFCVCLVLVLVVMLTSLNELGNVYSYFVLGETDLALISSLSV